MAESYIVLFITAANADEARQISRVLLEKKKVACVNIVPGISSHFWWQDKIDSAKAKFLNAYTIGNEEAAPPRFFYARVSKDGVEKFK